jgi:hypothetical protein
MVPSLIIPLKKLHKLLTHLKMKSQKMKNLLRVYNMMMAKLQVENLMLVAILCERNLTVAHQMTPNLVANNPLIPNLKAISLYLLKTRIQIAMMGAMIKAERPRKSKRSNKKLRKVDVDVGKNSLTSLVAAFQKLLKQL